MLEYGAEVIQSCLKTLVVGRRVEMHAQVGSTNDLAREAARRGEAAGLVVVTEEQVRGRGRLGRTWTAPAGSSILCSVLLRPRFSPGQAFYLTIAAALAIYRAVGGLVMEEKGGGNGEWGSGNAEWWERRTKDERRRMDDLRSRSGGIGWGEGVGGWRLSIKWPNDLLVNGRKVSGILSESEFVGGEWAFAVVGFGINVNMEQQTLAGLRENAPQATALSTELGVEVDRTLLLARVLGELDGLYSIMQNGQFGSIYGEWVAALETVGQRVSVQDGGGVLSGRAVRVERDGALVVRLQGGGERRVLAGDVVTW